MLPYLGRGTRYKVWKRNQVEFVYRLRIPSEEFLLPQIRLLFPACKLLRP